VTAGQIHHYESGRRSHTAHLPALLDMAYGGGGASCHARVPLRRVSGGFRTRLPHWWRGPLTIRVQRDRAVPGQTLTLSWPMRTHEHLLGASTREVLRVARLPGDHELDLGVPPGTAVDVWMGHDAAVTGPAIELANDWMPVDALTGSVLFDQLAQGILRVLGRRTEDLHAVLGDADRRNINGSSH